MLLTTFKNPSMPSSQNTLKSYDSYELSLFEADGITKISDMDSTDQLTNKKMPLLQL